MTYTRPVAKQDFELVISATDRDITGEFKDETLEFLKQAIAGCAHRFRPQAKPGMGIRIKITMEADL